MLFGACYVMLKLFLQETLSWPVVWNELSFTFTIGQEFYSQNNGCPFGSLSALIEVFSTDYCDHN